MNDEEDDILDLYWEGFTPTEIAGLLHLDEDSVIAALDEYDALP